ncbi:TRAP transporter large permease [uncultured Oscillibacter sp.]|uniref:TRAP transporter large permease n=1 Tax=uncultured Oscillibacter sp. TaxID=876091 RepID=UPI0025F51241|nr:TRAP transporter large permease subunit [uncultured Oscillibacter sp.]
MGLLVFLAALFVLLLIGVPIAIALGGCAIVLMLFLNQFNPLLLAQQMVVGVNSFPLMAIPFFMLAGEIMSKGGLSKRIVDFANVLMGRIRGGLGYTAIVASIIFAGLSGSAVADAAALGGILLPLMTVQGYRKERASGFICAGAIIAPIIPPSIPMIVLGTSVGLSISRMFMSGIVPGVILGIALMVVWYFVVRIDDYHDVVRFTREEGLRTIASSLPALFMPILIVGGIRLGIFTPTEAGAFAVVYAILVCMFVYKELTWKGLMESLVAACKSTATVMFICATASAVAWLITIAQVPAMAVQLFGNLIGHPMLLMLVINVFLFLMGMVMDLTPNILIFAPVLFPVITAAGIDPYYFALIMTLNLCIGMISPPVGTVLYVGCGVAKISFTQIVKGVFPFLMVELVTLILFIAFPSLVTVPLNLIMG